MDIGNISSTYSQYADALAKTSDAESLKNKIASSKDVTDEDLMKVCKEFEAYFMEQVYKEMLKTVPDSATGANSTLVDYFKDQAVSEIANRSVEQNNGTGLAQSLYEQMRRNYEN